MLEHPTQLLTVAQVCSALQLSRGTVERLIRSGALPSVNVSTTNTRRAHRVRPADLAMFLMAHEETRHE
ncbi:helix-turn-helix domain-containing protein [Deinococcus sonorensis]|uniref:Helix-turn-helix domain-containing protein n=1 Tax=Deinococcus sonorensis TaxID=309891 RepID=A0ABV8YCA8_9DEIO